MKRLLSVIMAISLLATIIIANPNILLVSSAEEKETYKGIFENGSFEDGLWNNYSGTGRYAQIKKADEGKTGNASLLLTRKQKTNSPLKISGQTVSGKVAELDKDSNYVIKMAIKTQDNFNGNVYITLTQGSKRITIDGSSNYYMLGTLLREGSANYSDWTEIVSSGFKVDSDDIKIDISVNGTGIIYIDDVDLVIDPEEDNMIMNAAFSSKWYQEGNGTQTIVTDETDKSPSAVKLESSEDGAINIASDMKEKFDRSKKYTLSMSVKTKGVTEGKLAVRILEWGKVDGADKSSWLKVYGNEAIIQPSGDSDWTTYAVNLSRFSNYDDYHCRFYVMLQGEGTVWVDNVSLREKKVNTDVKAGIVAPDTDPGDVSPMTVIRLMTASDPADIYYTVDGSDPKQSKNTMLYDDEEGIIITADTVIKAFVASEDGDGEVSEFSYTCPSILSDPDFEKNVWKSNVFGTSELDTTVKSTGNSSMKITGNGTDTYANSGLIAIDPNYDYKLSFRVKTADMLMDNSAYVAVFLENNYGGSTYASIDGQTVRGDFFKGHYKLIETKKSQDWTNYEFDLDDINSSSAISIYCGNKGDMGEVWFDSFNLIAKQNERYPLTLVSAEQSNQMIGNIYKQNVMEDFVIEKRVTFQNKCNLEETGTLSYSIKKANGDVLGTGDITDAGVAPGGKQSYDINLSPIAEYGKFIVDFKMENKRGYIYDIGEVRISRVRDGGNNQSSKLGMSQHAMTGGYLNEKYDEQSIDKYFDMLKASGVSAIREEVIWSNIEKSENTYTFPTFWDTYVNSANKHGIKVLLVINGASSSYHGSTSFPKTKDEITAFCNYAKAVAGKFKGRVYAYELLNETNFSKICTAEEYTVLLKEFYKTLKSVDSSNKVVAGVLSQADVDYAEGILKSGGANYMDVFSFHPYVYPKSPETADFIKKIESIKDLFSKYTTKKIPLWLTEIGWTTCNNDYGVTEEQQADYQIRALSMIEKLDYVEYIFHYETHSGLSPLNLESNWGMTEIPGNDVNSYAARENYVAYGAHNAMLDGYKYSGEQKYDNKLYAYKYSNSETGKDIYELWTNDLTLPATINLSKAAARYFDIYGNALSIDFDGNSFTDNLSGRPVYLMLDNSNSIESIVFEKKTKESNIETPQKENKVVEKIEQTFDNDYIPSHTPEYYNEEKVNDSAPQTYKVKRIKRTKGSLNNDDEGLSPLVIGLICGGSVILAAGVTLLLILLKKKRKAKI